MQLIIGIIFVLITGPLSSHMIMKAAYNIKTPYSKNTKLDEIKDDLKIKIIETKSQPRCYASTGWLFISNQFMSYRY